MEGLVDDERKEMAKGSWKPKSGEWAAFRAYTTFTGSFPSRVRLTYTSVGAADLRYLHHVIRPKAVVKASGTVADSTLIDDSNCVRFGTPDAMAQVRDSTTRREPAILEIEMTE